MRSEIETRELLSAYACGDVTPDQRVAVERLLAADGDADTELRELKALLPMLAQAERPVSGALLSALHKRIETLYAGQSREPAAAVLLCASLSGDVVASEKALVDEYLARHPEARKEQRSLRELSGLLKQGELPVSAALMARLGERLAGALPQPKTVSAPRKRETQVLKVQARDSEPTVRVLASTRMSVWRPRLMWTGAAVAALLTVAFGLWRLLEWRSANSTVIAGPTNDQGVKPEPIQQNVAQQPGPKDAGTAPGPEVAQHKTPDTQRPLIAHHDAPVVPMPVVPPNGGGNGTLVRPEVANDQTPGMAPPRQSAPQAGVTEGLAPKSPGGAAPKNANAPREQLPVVTNQPQTPRPHGGGGGGGGGGLTIPTGTGTTDGAVADTQNTTPNQTATPAVPADSAVVMHPTDGNVEAQLPDGTRVGLADNLVLPSGSAITTGQGRVGLRVPGDAILYVNSGSNLTMRLRGSETIVSLVNGEVAYHSDGAGTMSLTASMGAASVNKAKYANVKIAGSAMETSVLDGSAKVSAKGKDTTIAKGNKATVALAGNDAPRKEAITSRPPDTWSYDLNQTKIITTDNKNGPRSKSRSSGRN